MGECVLIRHLVMRRKLVAGVAAACGVMFVFLMGWLTLVDQSQRRMAEAADNYIGSFNRLMGEVDAALAELNARTPESCSRETVLRMRRAMVRHPGVEDMFFFPPGSRTPACSANMGLDHTFDTLPAPIETPFARNQRQYWSEIPLDLFDGTVRASIVKEGAFAAVTSFDRYLFSPQRGHWQVYMPQPDGSFGVHSGGEAGLHRRFVANGDSFAQGALYHNRCSATAAACITLHVPPSEMLANEGAWLLVMPARALVFAGLLWFLVYRLLAARGTEKGRIKVALKRKHGFSCRYQPIVDIASGEPVGCEVLARFEDEFGPLMPDVFVPIVEELDSTWVFTTIIIETAFADLAPLLMERPQFGVSVNFYPRDLTQESIPRLAACPTLQEASAKRYNLHFEVIETASGDLEGLSRTIDHLHGRGFLVSIDDFGTGSSNLEQVQTLKADFVKIDRSFMRDLRPSSSAIHTSFVPQIIEIARKVDVALIAEGIETAEQVQMLKKLGVRLGQGYHFARPLTLEDLLAYIAANSVAPEPLTMDAVTGDT